MSQSANNRRGRQQEVVCPQCQTVQMQPEGAISTNCRVCGSYFKLVEAAAAVRDKEQRAAKPTMSREIICVKCQTSNRVADAAMSTQCMKCANYLDLRDQVIRGTSSERIHTYGDLTFANGCVFRGFSAEAGRIEVLGKVASRLEAIQQIVTQDGSNISGEIKSNAITVHKGSVVSVEILTCQKLTVEGSVEVAGTAYALSIVVNKGGSLKAKHIRTREMEVHGELTGRIDIIPPEAA